MLDGVVVNYVFQSRKRLNSSSQTFLFNSVFSVSISLCLDWIIPFYPRISEALTTNVTTAQLTILAQQPHVS